MAHADIEALVRAIEPGARLLSVEPLAPDAASAGETTKAAGYGAPLKLRIASRDGTTRVFVLRTATANDFGHDRRSDRAQQQLLAFDTFNRVPSHIRALDVGVITRDGRLRSIAFGGELYLVTSYAEGTLYSEDLRQVAASAIASPLDLARAESLARYLVALHREPGDRPASYRRAIRDLVGHGEGIFGIVDDYGDEVPSAPPARLHAIERRCLDWRWRLRSSSRRLRRTHGDFHPFNIVFAGDTRFTLLDASRGGQGDPADDVAALVINYVFFALESGATWARGFAPLWRRFFEVYLEESHDVDLLDVIAPFLAWRGLVVVNPTFYPSVTPRDRDRMLGFVERTLDARRFDPASAEELFR